jgi:hypothetical protein
MANNGNGENSKPGAKFQRASLRARNKTLMMTPADVSDYQTKFDTKGGDPFDLSEIFEDTVSDGDIDSDGGEIRQETSDPLDAVLAESDELLEGTQYEGTASDSNRVNNMSSSDRPREESVSSPFASKVADIFSNQGSGGVSASAVSTGAISSFDDGALDSPPPMGNTASSGKLLFRPPGAATAPQMVRGASSAPPRKVAPIAAPLVVEGGPIVRETRELATTDSGFSQVESLTSRSLKGEVAPKSMAEHKSMAKGELDITPQKGAMAEPLYRERVEWRIKSKLVGFLVSYESDPMGRYIELREGRLLVTKDVKSNDSYLLIEHESVSPLHATMKISDDGSILVLDQLSERGTKIKRVDGSSDEVLNGDKGNLFHGDIVVFGDCEYHLALVAQRKEPTSI